MKVVILCGGLGTRMREETEYRPKPMVEIGGKPILWHIMKTYAQHGFTEFVLCLGYKGEIVKEYFYHYEVLSNDFTVELGSPSALRIHGNHNKMNWKVTLVDTGDHSLKGARLKKAEKYIDSDDFMVTYGDGVADIDIKDLLTFHRKHGKIGTLTGVRPPSRFGAVVVKEDKVVSFTEKPQVSEGLISGGFFVFNRKFFKYLSETDPLDLEFGALEVLAKDKQLMVYKHSGEWECMDTYRDMLYLNKLWDSKKAFWKAWKD